MAQIQGTVLAAKISPGDTSATFPTHEDIYGKGGLMSVQTLSELATSIPQDRQKVGMMIYVSDTSSYYTLTSVSYPLTSFSPVSNTFSTKDYSHSNFFPLTGNATITGPLQVNSNVLIYGNLSATGTSNFSNTIFSTTTALSVVHIGDGPAMWVGNSGTGDIASFYDIDQGVEVLHVAGTDGTFPGVGIRTATPNKAFTVNGEISANNIIWDASGNSLNWNNVYSSVASTSANWQSTYNSVNNLSSRWDLGYTGYNGLTALSANWQSTYTTMTANSANWQSTYTTMTANSANWQNTYSTVQANSATTWNYQGTDLKNLSANWVGGNIAYTNLIANSGAYLSGVDLSFLSVSANWNNTYTAVSPNSANWQSTYTTMTANSANWQSTYNAVNTLSSRWELGYTGYVSLTSKADLSGAQFTGAVTATSLSATGSITASQSIIPVTVTNLSSDKVFVDADTNKIFHFNTSSSALTASFPSALLEGFNVAIMNTGTNYLYISSNTQINAASNKLIGIYTGAYVYKSDLNIFAVGGL